MSVELVGVIVAVATPIVGVIYWVSKLEGRVQAQEQRHDEMREDIQYIRDRIDSALFHQPR
jgi:hypothetical protein